MLLLLLLGLRVVGELVLGGEELGVDEAGVGGEAVLLLGRVLAVVGLAAGVCWRVEISHGCAWCGERQGQETVEGTRTEAEDLEERRRDGLYFSVQGKRTGKRRGDKEKKRGNG